MAIEPEAPSCCRGPAYRASMPPSCVLAMPCPASRSSALVETKSAARVAPDGLRTLERVGEAMAKDEQFRGRIERVVVYGGDERLTIRGTELLPWSRVAEFAWR